MKHISWFIISILLTASCKQPKELVYQDIENFGVKKVGLKQTTVSMDIRLYNPNRYKIKLKETDVDVFLNGTHLG